MNTIETQVATYSSCVVELSPETMKQLGIALGSTVIMHANDGRIEVEILPPPSPALLTEIHETYEEMKDVFAEMKRRGD
jgi:hypothetical protein